MTDILDLQGWKALGTRLDGDEYEIEAEYTVLPDVCPKCGCVGNLYRHGPKPITIRDSPIRGKHVRILARAQRYKCRDCDGTFIQPLGGIHGATRMTERCVEYIESQCLRDTFLRVAEHIGCDDKTVRNLAGDYIERLNTEYKPWLPEWLGIDETQIDGKLRCIITDVVNRVPIDMLPDRDKPLVTAWLHQFKDLGGVKGLAIDMWRPYQRIAAELLPQAAVVVDKFHIMRMASEAMDKVRIRLAKAKDTDVRRHWVRSKVMLNKRPHNLTVKQRFNLDMWLDNEPEIADAYRAKEAFYSLFDLPKAEAIQAFDDFAASVPASVKPEFKPLLTAMRNWRSEILAVFDHPYTNAFTESLNNLTKHIVKAGRGYSFEVLRARILAKYGDPVKKPLRIEFLIKDSGNPCANCGLACRAEDMHLVTLPPVTRGQRAKRALVCGICEPRFNTERLLTHRKTSTRKTG